MAQRLLPLAIMALGLMGHGLALRGFFHVTCEFVPAILGSCVIVWVTAGGMLGFLDAAVWSFNGLGVLMLLCVGLKKRFRRNSDRRFPMALGLLLFLGILLAVYLNDKKLTHYDNFSHWGTIVKSMVLERALPGRDSSLITFQSYPPGSAVFIYYILQGIGWSESHALIAQGLLIISFALALLAGMPQQKKLLWLAVFLGFSLFLCFNYVTIHDLLVDALLACCGLACSIYIMTSYSKRGANAWLAVMLCACYLIKNSGLFYVAINTALLFVCVLRQGDSAKRIKNIVRCSLVAVMPWLMLLLWSAHTKNNFDYATETIHALSVENYAAVLGEKTWDDIAAITKGYWSKYLEIQSPEIVMLIFFDCSLLVASSVLALSERRYDAKKLMWFALKLNGVLICYAVGLWAMYLLSMPPDEAMTVNGFERYLCGFLVWMYGYSLWRLLGWYAANENNTRLVAGLMCICLTISCLGYMLKRESLVSYHSGKVDRYDRIVQQLEEYNPDEYYTLLYPANGYDWFCMRYKLWTADLDWRSQISAEDAEDIISYYDYLIVLDQTEAVKKVLAPYVAGPEYTGGYQVTWEDELVLIPAM